MVTCPNCGSRIPYRLYHSHAHSHTAALNCPSCGSALTVSEPFASVILVLLVWSLIFVAMLSYLKLVMPPSAEFAVTLLWLAALIPLGRLSYKLFGRAVARREDGEDNRTSL